MKLITSCLAVLVVLASTSVARADTFGTGANEFDKVNLGVPVTGSYPTGYDEDASRTGSNIPTDNVSWWEAAQFVNWLNTSTDNHAAYKFTGTQGTGNYAFALWSAAEAAHGTYSYRHKDAFYFLPTEDEWVKAAYWNGVAVHFMRSMQWPESSHGFQRGERVD